MAIADYNTALKLDKNYVSAYNNRGVALYRKGDNDRALVEYNTALRLAPNDADVYNNRGISFNEKGDLDRAIADYSEAIRLNPKYVNALANRAFTYEKKGMLPEALTDFRHGDPDDGIGGGTVVGGPIKDFDTDDTLFQDFLPAIDRNFHDLL